MTRKRITLLCLLALFALPVILTACGQTAADVASKNLSTEAEQFKIARRIVFINGITDKYLLTITGYCSVETGNSALTGSLEVTCKTGPHAFKKSFLGLSDNVTYMVQQVDAADVSTARYEVIFRPSTIIPDNSGQIAKAPRNFGTATDIRVQIREAPRNTGGRV